VSDAEVDAYSRWGRRYLIYIGRPGVRKSIKRITHKRERRQGRREATLDA
jgi:hypothetical protein